jgi:hypothetical protein
MLVIRAMAGGLARHRLIVLIPEVARSVKLRRVFRRVVPRLRVLDAMRERNHRHGKRRWDCQHRCRQT